jgi:exodeoxyribonuclease-3
MKIASWNINSVRFRLDIVSRFLREMAPDILCLQETKAENSVFPMEALKSLGYPHIVINGQKMHHGVAILSKVPLVEDRSHDWQDNGEARHIGVRLPNGVLLENVYVPAGGDIPDREQNPKFGQKLDFLGRMIDWSSSLSEPTILTGDFNIAPLESDVWNHKQLIDACPPASKSRLGRSRTAFRACAGPSLHLVELPRKGLGGFRSRQTAGSHVGVTIPARTGGQPYGP